MSFWKILRVLVSNRCNYQCEFCHNEGQEKQKSKIQLLPFDEFKLIVASLQDSEIKDIQFSGGEPFLNPRIIEMIEFVQTETVWEIGCATNGQLITESIGKRLGKTRTRLNINLPSLDPTQFGHITGGGSLPRLLKKLSMLDTCEVDYGFNSVLYSGEASGIKDLIDFISLRGKRLKILPYLNTNYPSQPVLDNGLIEFIGKLAESSSIQTTSRRWILKDRGKGKSVIKYVDFPCRQREIAACRDYAEVRLLPDFSIQTCLINPNRRFILDMDLSKKGADQQIREVFERAWKNFISC